MNMDYTVELPEFPEYEPMDEIEVDEVIEGDVEVEPPRKRISYKGQILEIR